MAVTMFVACNNDNGDEDATTTTTTTTTTKRKTDDIPDIEIPEEKTLLAEGESEWKYHVVEVSWVAGEAGVMDYLQAEVHGFNDFVTANPTWMNVEFDDSEWGSKAAPFGNRDSEANATAIGWTGDNHGLFLRTTFEITQEDLNDLSSESATLYAYTWYDNTCHMYLNGTEFFVHDDSHKYQAGVAGDDKSLNVHDWVDAREVIFFDEYDDRYVYEGNVWDLLVVGENTLAVSLLDCWGDREFDFGLYIEYEA